MERLLMKFGCTAGQAAADGGMWKLAARDAVKCYLETALCDEIAAGKVNVTL